MQVQPQELNEPIKKKQKFKNRQEILEMPLNIIQHAYQTFEWLSQIYTSREL